MRGRFVKRNAGEAIDRTTLALYTADLMKSTSQRLSALQTFVSAALQGRDFDLTPASADASFRNYWRVRVGTVSWLVMDAPPEHEDCRPWLDVGGRLRAAGLHAPQVLAKDLRQGFLLIEDLGERTYLPELDEVHVDELYGAALRALFTMQTRVDATGLPHYDETRLRDELALMPTWFLARHLGLSPTCEEGDVMESAFRCLLDNALAQPKVFVHRDYHSRNLLITRDNSPGIIDFQDALVGPITYDLVSLLRDCYIVWPEARVLAWARTHHQALVSAGFALPSVALFQRWLDLMGLQRHIKVLGIFCRLYYRDDKAGYLGDLPRVWNYIDNVAAPYPELADFLSLMRGWISHRELGAPAA